MGKSYKALSLFVCLSLMLVPLGINAESQISAGVTANVVQPTADQITLNSITATKTSGNPDGTFENGWKWTFDVTVPNTTETNLSMKFEDWMSLGQGNFNITVANNLRFYSEQSSNAFNPGSAIFVTSAGTFSAPMVLAGDLDSNQSTRRVKITVEFKIPSGAQMTSYSTNFAIKTH